ncbi:MAG: VgrG-related protein [Actinomycetota bacterium]
MSEQQAAVSFRILVDGTELSQDVAARVTDVIVEDEVNLPDAAIVVLDDAARAAIGDTGAKLGGKLEIRVKTETEASGGPIFVGEITALEMDVDGERVSTIIRGYDKTHRLQRGSLTETHLDMTVGDVVTKVAKRHGLSVGETGSLNAVHESLVQWNRSDWDFLSELAAEGGHEVVVDDDDKLSFREPNDAAEAPGEASPDTATARQLVAGRNLLRLRATMNGADQVGDVEVRGWDPKTKKEVVGEAKAKKATTHQSGVDPAAVARDLGGATLVRSDLPVDNVETANAAAKSIVEQLGSVAAELEGVTDGDPELRAGRAVSVSGLGQPFDGKYTLTSCRHTISPEVGYRTTFRVSGHQQRSLYGVAGAGLGSPVPDVNGVVPGVVSDIDDPEQLGRVKVSFPWLGEQAVSPWARIVMPGGGPDRGIVFRPEVHDEVLVAFHHGDVRLPYVLGGLHNGTDKMPPGLRVEKEIMRRTIVSRTGHQVTLDDEKGSILIEVAESKMGVHLDGEQTTILVNSEGNIEITSAADVKISSDGAMSLSAKGDFTAEAKGAVSIKGMGVAVDAGGANFEAKGVQAKMTGSAQAEVSAPQSKLAGSAMTEITGALVKIN